MIILAWNCRGLGQSSAIRDLKALVHDSKHEIICLIEAKISDAAMKLHLIRLHFENSIYFTLVGLFGGLCVAWKDHIDLEPVSVFKNLVSCLIFSNHVSTPWLLSVVYGPVCSIEKRSSWNNFHKSMDRFNGAWLVFGDFNGVISSLNRHGGREEISSSVHMINALDNLGLLELPSQGLKYTWSNGKDDDSIIRAKPDRGVANADWWDLFPNVDVKILPNVTSDHSPIILNSDGGSNFLRRPFRFEVVWTRDIRSHWVVNHAWTQANHWRPSTRLSCRLYHTRKGISLWNKTQFSKVQTNIQNMRKSLAVCREPSL
ncbi:hypothetical protein UlMin_024909 [Ulmus minor]